MPFFIKTRKFNDLFPLKEKIKHLLADAGKIVIIRLFHVVCENLHTKVESINIAAGNFL